MSKRTLACCGTCDFWRKIRKSPLSGECRRYAPRPQAISTTVMDNFLVEWPDTYQDDWCGEWRKKEC